MCSCHVNGHSCLFLVQDFSIGKSPLCIIGSSCGNFGPFLRGIEFSLNDQGLTSSWSCADRQSVRNPASTVRPSGPV